MLVSGEIAGTVDSVKLLNILDQIEKYSYHFEPRVLKSSTRFAKQVRWALVLRENFKKNLRGLSNWSAKSLRYQSCCSKTIDSPRNGCDEIYHVSDQYSTLENGYSNATLEFSTFSVERTRFALLFRLR